MFCTMTYTYMMPDTDTMETFVIHGMDEQDCDDYFRDLFPTATVIQAECNTYEEEEE